MATAIIRLMQGVVYRDADEDTWLTLERAGAGVRDHFATIGIDVVVDDAEGYAYLRSRPSEDGEEELPRLVRRRALTYNVSLLLVLLRKRLVEFETSGGDGRLVLSTEQIVEMLRLFQADSTNDARVVDQAETTIRKTAEFGFLRQLRGQRDHWEVRRILKAYVDAQTLSDFAAKLRQYAGAGAGDELNDLSDSRTERASRGGISTPVRRDLQLGNVRRPGLAVHSRRRDRIADR
ncbi:DUF4194 domain-containing protein [Mycolicibacterium smegmatis]|uniref:DUF4194 domain-containing protein n=1 Tax=Mycolicibacterium smegmatis TaxID=1772 RepID=UPI0002E3AFB2|nr:DUF4194 domain-containing protein [Mycolicibacterium smegmatis]UUR97596.1 DUF4194 domain-containing protein [Mycolicibacterium smegmatis]UUS04151.1 DUF4194 domain-containing protein [Mycolicibacterium smegmatis]UUS10706.1 DUF4194 domain-containing protein [Mycolicibacterium smegmatis]UUS20531.1 DUF4194 domain-containing protein [Mycolicibacterium smegmatis]UUS27084.1 DUF4194 domain-containing protein [Mycolicibacterium smegmatis]